MIKICREKMGYFCCVTRGNTTKMIKTGIQNLIELKIVIEKIPDLLYNFLRKLLKQDSGGLFFGKQLIFSKFSNLIKKRELF